MEERLTITVLANTCIWALLSLHGGIIMFVVSAGFLRLCFVVMRTSFVTRNPAALFVLNTEL
jgi:hypothetical protein